MRKDDILDSPERILENIIYKTQNFLDEISTKI
jgi:hypothetical protein